jgi:NADPH:quinone reductase-like Zn-dependent oxidoreductase
MARYFDAYVNRVCNTKNVELVRSLGADEVVDYTQEDFTKNGRTYDVILYVVGKHSFMRCRGSLSPGGVYMSSDGWENLLLALLTAPSGGKMVRLAIPPGCTKQDVLFLKELIDGGKYQAVIDRCCPLEHVVDATKYVEMEQKTGNVVLIVSSDGGHGSARR